MTQENQKNFSPRNFSILYIVKLSLISALGNWAGDLLLYPLDVIATRLKASKHVHHKGWPFAITTIRNEGLKVYKGFTFLTFPYSFIPAAIYLFVYENLMRFMSETVDRYTNSKGVKLFFPFFISGIAEIVCLIA